MAARRWLMKDSHLVLSMDWRLSPRWVIAALAATGWGLAFAAELSDRSVAAAGLGLLMLGASAAAWLLDRRNDGLGRWFTTLSLAAIALLAGAVLHLPGSPAWLTIPVALAVALLGVRPATGLAAAATVWLLAMGVEDAAVALVAIWSSLGAMAAVTYPAREAMQQAWAHYQQTQSLLDDSQGHKAELAQAMDDLVYANRQLALANERANAWRLSAEEAQKAKTMFVAKVSHELRTPLNMIIGLVNLMLDSPEIYTMALSPDMRKDLTIVHRNCEHLARMVNDVLNLTQMETGRLALHREQVDLNEIVESAVESVSPLIQKKGLSISVDAPRGALTVSCDRTRIQQVVLNLLSNAARFTEQGGITVRIEAQEQQVAVSVSDTGPGITPADAERIFEPFCQGTDRLWRDTGGSGLGLTISKQFVELHGGRIWLESQPGQGADFHFSLPYAEPAPHLIRPGRWISEDYVWLRRRSYANFPDTHYRPRIVVCDETGGLRASLAQAADGVEWVAAADLQAALDELRRCPAHAVVVNATDASRLPELVGAASRASPGTPIIGCAVPNVTERVSASDASAFLVKPVTLDDMKRAIAAISKPVRNILIVDDDPDVLELYGRMLRTWDPALRVTTAATVSAALDSLRRDPPDVLLLDVVLADMSGYQLLDRLRRDEATARLPVVFVSAQDPMGQPSRSEAVLATISEGLSVNKVLECSAALAAILLAPDGAPLGAPPGAPDSAPPQTAEAGMASSGSGSRPANRPVLLP
jgi:signal transduction histidine kinase/CheY-like chemotaxis protein